MDPQIGSASSRSLRFCGIKAPNSIPGLRPREELHTNVVTKSASQQSTPSSDESNSPTELNTCKRLADKPPLIKQLAIEIQEDSSDCPLLAFPSIDNNTSSSPINRPNRSIRERCNKSIIEDEKSLCNSKISYSAEAIDNTINSSLNEKSLGIESDRLSENSLNSEAENDFDSKQKSLFSSSSNLKDGSNFSSMHHQTLISKSCHNFKDFCEEGELKRAPWFQAGIPREITLEVLSQEPEGAFMVRKSTSKPGCYALSLRVPREFQPTGIAHYLIMRTNKGYKIKGFTKEFTTLTALITHHSVMPELLPHPLSLSRYNPSFIKSDTCENFADIVFDADFYKQPDFRKTIADSNV